MTNTPNTHAIQDLINNIQHKFDHQFQHHHLKSSFQHNQFIPQESIYNPQSENISDGKIPIKQQLTNTLQQSQIQIQNQQQQQPSSQTQTNQPLPSTSKQPPPSTSKQPLPSTSKQPPIQQQNQQQNTQQQQQQSQSNKINDVSVQFKTALTKLSNSKNQTHSNHGFQNLPFLNRIQDYQTKKQKYLQQKRKIQQQKKYPPPYHSTQHLKPKPDINPKSRQLVQQTQYRPIYERFDSILQAKKQKHLQNQQHKKHLQQSSFQSFINQYKSHQKLQPQQCRDTQQYFQDMITWKTRIDKSISDKIKQKQLKQIQPYTFKPQLNSKSIKMLRNHKRIPIYQRQITKSKTQQPQYTFKPKINKKK